jgi:hypothetical protein
MSLFLSPPPKTQFFDNNGNLAIGGKLYTYISGSTAFAITYIDSDKTPNTNPIILDSRGECEIYLDANTNYKFVLRDSLDNLIWSKDNIIFSGVSLETVQSMLPGLATQTEDGLMSHQDKTKLDGLPSTFDGQMSANDILTQLKTVDGAGSELDADLLDGQHGQYYLDLITAAQNAASTAQTTANEAKTTATAAQTTANNAVNLVNDLKYSGPRTIGSYYLFFGSYTPLSEGQYVDLSGWNLPGTWIVITSLYNWSQGAAWYNCLIKRVA